MEIAKVENRVITEKDILNYLKFIDDIGPIAQKVVNRYVTVEGAKKMGITVTDAELQDAADAYRKLAGMFEPKDVMDWLEFKKTDLDSWEAFLEEQLFVKKVTEQVSTEEKIAAYFNSNKPEFERVELDQLVLESMDAAKEAAELLKEGEEIAVLARDESIDPETKNAAGYLGFVRRGALPELVEAKVFNAGEGDVLGPFQMMEDWVIVLKVITAKSCEFTDKIKRDISKKLFEKWRDRQANILKVEWI